MDKSTTVTSRNGWKAPQNSFDMQQEFFAKHGQDPYTEAIDRRWRRLGKLIDKGARIEDGRLGS